uniref:Putative secreted protein n=1 Tax=Anopheles triannulatus TaxID=58253 RepID=A0A2M4B699_9DIPT
MLLLGWLVSSSPVLTFTTIVHTDTDRPTCRHAGAGRAKRNWTISVTLRTPFGGKRGRASGRGDSSTPPSPSGWRGRRK